MKKFFYLLPRQSGKTTMAIMEFLRDPERTLFITFNQKSADRIKEVVEENALAKKTAYVSIENLSNIISCKYAINYCIGKEFDKIILDEYMYFDASFDQEKDNIFETLTKNGNIIIYSTSDKIYSEEVFDFLRTHKYNMTVSEQVERWNNFSKEQQDDLKRLENSLLVNPEVKLITSSPFMKSVNYSKICDQTSKYLRETEYKMETLNIFLQ